MRILKLFACVVALLVASTFLPAPRVLEAQLNRVSVNQIFGTLPETKGGTGQASYTIGDLLYASAATTLSKLTDVAAGSYLRSGGTSTAPVWSTATLPNTATTGDLIMATGTNVFGVRAAVATGQVLASAGTGTAPAYTATPSVTSLTVAGGTGTGTLKASGRLCDTIAANCSAVAYTDASVQNQWNVMSLTLPASTLAVNGDAVVVHVSAKMAANANAKAFQLYWNGGTCSGSGASCCSTGTQIYSDGDAGSGVAFFSLHTSKRLSSGNQLLDGASYAGAAQVKSADYQTSTATDTGTIPVAFCARNTAAAATTLQGTPYIEIDYKGQ